MMLNRTGHIGGQNLSPMSRMGTAMIKKPPERNQKALTNNE